VRTRGIPGRPGGDSDPAADHRHLLSAADAGRVLFRPSGRHTGSGPVRAQPRPRSGRRRRGAGTVAGRGGQGAAGHRSEARDDALPASTSPLGRTRLRDRGTPGAPAAADGGPFLAEPSLMCGLAGLARAPGGGGVSAEMLGRLNGQFAFAIYDRRTETVLLARDRFGVRPLFYAIADGDLFFASEAKALFASGGVEAAPDFVGLDQVFTFWAARPPWTVFRGVHSIEPGCFAGWREWALRRCRDHAI